MGTYRILKSKASRLLMASIVLAFSLAITQPIISNATITYTKVGEIEEDSNYVTPYIGYATDISTCINNVIVCHLEGNGYQTTYNSRSVWKMPRLTQPNNTDKVWSLYNLTISTDVQDSDPRSYQKICFMAKDISKKKIRESLDYRIDYKIGDITYNLAQWSGINVSKKGFKEHCKYYRVIGSKNNINIAVFFTPWTTVVIDKITLYQGGSGPSIIDEIAAHPFDTGTK